jgi:hypothetical protein
MVRSGPCERAQVAKVCATVRFFHLTLNILIFPEQPYTPGAAPAGLAAGLAGAGAGVGVGVGVGVGAVAALGASALGAAATENM